MTKKTLVATVVLFFILVSSVWASPPKGKLMNDYFSLRFVTVKHANSLYDIDFNQVQAVLFDGACHIQKEFSKTGMGCGSDWVIFKNGFYVIPEVSDGTKAKWNDYKDFLRQNPQFLTIP